MSTSSDEFFLLIGANFESTTSRLSANGVRYRTKLLESGPDNWRTIVGFLRDPGIKGAIAVFTGYDYCRFESSNFESVGRDLLDALKDVPHVIFVHEAVFFFEHERTPSPLDEIRREERRQEQQRQEELIEELRRSDPSFDLEFPNPHELFGVVPDEVRARVNEALAFRALNVLPYRTNAERSTMAAQFLDDLDRHLVFRVYIPAGRLYADEASTLIGLFRNWLNQTGRDAVRQDGYSTPAGHVYEFFSENSHGGRDLTLQFQDFSDFLEACSVSPEQAARDLEISGIDRHSADQMVTRYAKAARRLHLDLRHAREQRVLSLRQQFESELIDSQASGLELQRFIDNLVPSENVATMVMGSQSGWNPTPPASQINVTVNQQVIRNMTGNVVQNLQGTVNLGPDAQQLLELIGTFGGTQASELESAVHEVEDDAARVPDRIVARQKLRRFLSMIGPNISTAAVSTLQKYLESRLGL
ncbi:hypothetical protein [Nocardia sp. NPDC050710]|uniref:hypothetical protein n=1 Tax=Nocardia sp. NPDC050710 TaxID=3157220 RepID=UPI0033FF887D